MSKNDSEKKEVINIDLIITRLNELRRLIEILQNQVNTLSQELGELQLALASIKGLSEVTEEREALIAVDRLATVFVPAKIHGSWSKNLLVNIGRNYYVKTDNNTAEKIISKRIGVLQNMLRLRQEELARVVNEYNYLQQLITSAIYSVRQKK